MSSSSRVLVLLAVGAGAAGILFLGVVASRGRGGGGLNAERERSTHPNGSVPANSKVIRTGASQSPMARYPEEILAGLRYGLAQAESREAKECILKTYLERRLIDAATAEALRKDWEPASDPERLRKFRSCMDQYLSSSDVDLKIRAQSELKRLGMSDDSVPVIIGTLSDPTIPPDKRAFLLKLLGAYPSLEARTYVKNAFLSSQDETVRLSCLEALDCGDAETATFLRERYSFELMPSIRSAIIEQLANHLSVQTEQFVLDRFQDKQESDAVRAVVALHLDPSKPTQQSAMIQVATEATGNQDLRAHVIEVLGREADDSQVQRVLIGLARNDPSDSVRIKAIGAFYRHESLFKNMDIANLLSSVISDPKSSRALLDVACEVRDYFDKVRKTYQDDEHP